MWARRSGTGRRRWGRSRRVTAARAHELVVRPGLAGVEAVLVLVVALQDRVGGHEPVLVAVDPVLHRADLEVLEAVDEDRGEELLDVGAAEDRLLARQAAVDVAAGLPGHALGLPALELPRPQLAREVHVQAGFVVVRQTTQVRERGQAHAPHTLQTSFGSLPWPGPYTVDASVDKCRPKSERDDPEMRAGSGHRRGERDRPRDGDRLRGRGKLGRRQRPRQPRAAGEETVRLITDARRRRDVRGL